LSRQRRDNLGIRENVGKLDHAAETFLGETAAIVSSQLTRYICDDRITIGRPLVLENIDEDSLPTRQ
jgi:hypothetical protein